MDFPTVELTFPHLNDGKPAKYKLANGLRYARARIDAVLEFFDSIEQHDALCANLRYALDDPENSEDREVKRTDLMAFYALHLYAGLRHFHRDITTEDVLLLNEGDVTQGGKAVLGVKDEPEPEHVGPQTIREDDEQGAVPTKRDGKQSSTTSRSSSRASGSRGKKRSR